MANKTMASTMFLNARSNRAATFDSGGEVSRGPNASLTRKPSLNSHWANGGEHRLHEEKHQNSENPNRHSPSSP